MSDDPSIQDLGRQPFCYLTTTGRVTGRAHEIEIWFGMAWPTVYLLAGGGERADWVRNMKRTQAVVLRVAERVFDARARTDLDDREAEIARTLLYDKYQAGYSGDLTRWRDTALPVAVDLTAPRSRML